MRPRVAFAFVAALLLVGCTEAPRPHSARELARAEAVARAYLDAAAARDTARLCALRTRGSVSRWGGQRACERRARGLLLGPYRRSTSRALKLRLARRGAAVDAANAEILDADTHGSGGRASVWVDYGKAVVEGGHATGGQIIEIELKRERDRYRVARVGFAIFAD